LAFVLVLRPARPVPVVAPVHGLLVLRAVAICDVLWTRLDRNGAADGAAHRAAVRTGASQSGIRLDLRRSSVGRWRRGIRGWPVANRARHLSARILRRWRAVRGGRADHADDRTASETGGGVSLRLEPISRSVCRMICEA